MRFAWILALPIALIAAACGSDEGVVAPDPEQKQTKSYDVDSLRLEARDRNGLLYTTITGAGPSGYLPLDDSVAIGEAAPTQRWHTLGADIAGHDWSLDRAIWEADSVEIRRYRPIWSGTWSGVSRRNLPIRLEIAGRRHYGWIRLSVDSITGVPTIHDAAYNPTPDEPMLAGVRP